jgi:thiol:disulfide interchange protein
MGANKTATFDKMRPTTRVAFLCLLGLVFAIPWITINLIVRMPNRKWTIYAVTIFAWGAVWLATGALQRRARADSQAQDKPSASEKTSN